MRIRKATLDDLPEMILLGRAMHEESPRFSRSPFSEVKTTAVITGLIVSGRGMALLAIRDSEIVGMLVGVISEHFFSASAYACDLVVYVKPENRGSSAAVRMVKEWDAVVCKVVDESVLGISTEVNAERTKRFYEKLGYKQSGFTMVKYYDVRRTN